MTEVATRDLKTGAHCTLLLGGALAKWWPDILSMLQQVPHTWTDYTIDYFLWAVQEKRMQVWGAGMDDRIHLVMFTQLATYPRRNVVEVIWACGDNYPKSLRNAVAEAVDEFGRANECSEVRVVGRRGWERVLKDFGFVRDSVIMSRPIAEKRTQ